MSQWTSRQLRLLLYRSISNVNFCWNLFVSVSSSGYQSGANIGIRIHFMDRRHDEERSDVGHLSRTVLLIAMPGKARTLAPWTGTGPANNCHGGHRWLIWLALAYRTLSRGPHNEGLLREMGVANYLRKYFTWICYGSYDIFIIISSIERKYCLLNWYHFHIWTSLTS